MENDPLDLYGAWYDDNHFLSGTIQQTENDTSISSIWLNKVRYLYLPFLIIGLVQTYAQQPKKWNLVVLVSLHARSVLAADTHN